MKLVVAKCPNCNAKIDVDKDSDSTKCEYCKSKIIVDDAIQKYKVELTGEITIKNLPKKQNLLKLADRYYENEEYEESLSYYEKVIELDPDCIKAILRRGIIKTINSGYNNIDFTSSIKAISNANDYASTDEDLELLNNSITSVNNVFVKKLNYLKSIPSNAKMDFDEVNNLNNNLLNCIKAFESLYSFINDEEIKEKVATNILITSNTFLAERYYFNYARNSYYKFKVRNDLINKVNNIKNKYTPTNIQKKSTDNKAFDIVLMILCYLMVAFFVISFIAFIDKGFNSSLLLISAVLFLPQAKLLFRTDGLYVFLVLLRILIPIFSIVIVCS